MVFDSRRPGPSPDGGADAGAPLPDVLGAQYPTLVQFLTLSRYGDGAARVPGSITLFFDTGTLKACLNDKDASLTAFVSGVGLAGLLGSIEDGLLGDRLDWRPAGPKKRR